LIHSIFDKLQRLLCIPGGAWRWSRCISCYNNWSSCW